MPSFSALQRAEIAEIERYFHDLQHAYGFSALQRAEIAEMRRRKRALDAQRTVSVLFNEPKLLKCSPARSGGPGSITFQCSSTSRNC